MTELTSALEETLGPQLLQAYLATKQSELAFLADKSSADQISLLYNRY